MKKRLAALFVLLSAVLIFASCSAVSKRPHWYYAHGGYYTYRTSPLYKRYGHWKGGGHTYSYDNVRSRAKVGCPGR